MGEADRAGVGGKGLGLEMTLKAWQLPTSVWGGPQEAPTRGTSPGGVPSQRKWQGRGLGQPKPSTYNHHSHKHFLHASSRGWHPRSAARHLLPERKGPSPQPPQQHEPARVPGRRASHSRAPCPGRGLSGGGPSRPPAPPSSVSGRRGLSLPPGFAPGATSPGAVCLPLTLSGCTSWAARGQAASACGAKGGATRTEGREGLPKRRGRLDGDNWASCILYQSITFIVFPPDRRQRGNDKSQSGQ